MKKKIFITIDIPEEIKENFRKEEKRWKNLNVFWIGRSSLYLTMEYLGIVDKTGLEKIKEAVEKTSEEFGQLRIKLNRIVLGPNEKDPKMFWATIMEDREILNFRRTLKKNLQNSGFEIEENDFVPHIVLAIAKGNQLKGKKTNVPIQGQFEVKEINLLSTHTYTKGFVKHKVLETFILEK